MLCQSHQQGVACASTYMAMLSFLKSFRNVGHTQDGDSRELSDSQLIGSAITSLGRWIAKLGPDMRSEWLEAQVRRTGNGKQVSTNIGRAPSGSWSRLRSTGRGEALLILRASKLSTDTRRLWRKGVKRWGRIPPGGLITILDGATIRVCILLSCVLGHFSN